MAFLKGDEATAYLEAIKKSGENMKLKTVDQLSSTEFMTAARTTRSRFPFIALNCREHTPANVPVSSHYW